MLQVKNKKIILKISVLRFLFYYLKINLLIIKQTN